MELLFSAYYFQGDVNEGKVANVASTSLPTGWVFELSIDIYIERRTEDAAGFA